MFATILGGILDYKSAEPLAVNQFEQAAESVLKSWDGKHDFAFIVQTIGQSIRVVGVVYKHEQDSYLVVSWFTGRTQTFRVLGPGSYVKIDDGELSLPAPIVE